MDDNTRRIIRETVHETLTGLGINIDDPTEAQEDFAYLRRLRLGATKIRSTIINGTLLVIVCSALYAIGQNIKSLGAAFFSNLHNGP